HTAKAFLGVTLNCARCHDHFFDPIAQQEYYQFRAFFEPYHVRTDRLPGEPDLNKAGLPRAYDSFLDAKTYLFIRGNEANPDASNALEPAIPAALGGRPLEIRTVALPLSAYRPDKREFAIAEALQEGAAAIAIARRVLAANRPNGIRGAVQLISLNPLQATMNVAAAQQSLTMFALAELDVPLAEVRHEALAATVRAEELEDAGKKDSAEWREVARNAASLQRKQALLEA